LVPPGLILLLLSTGARSSEVLRFDRGVPAALRAWTGGDEPITQLISGP
jgi:hypothetical protein